MDVPIHQVPRYLCTCLSDEHLVRQVRADRVPPKRPYRRRTPCCLTLYLYRVNTTLYFVRAAHTWDGSARSCHQRTNRKTAGPLLLKQGLDARGLSECPVPESFPGHRWGRSATSPGKLSIWLSPQNMTPLPSSCRSSARPRTTQGKSEQISRLLLPLTTLRNRSERHHLGRRTASERTCLLWHCHPSPGLYPFLTLSYTDLTSGTF